MDARAQKQVKTTTAARALVDALLREGVDHVFGIPGTQNLAVLDALRDTPQIRFILTRHEQGAAFMAYGYARAAKRPAIVTATEGPGVTNLVTAIGAAFRGYVPVISVCGVQESAMRERDATQDMDQIPFLRPITKWAYSIPNPQKVQESVRKAFRVALTEPQGPAHIEASSEILLEPVVPEPIEPEAYRTTVLPSCDAGQLDRAFELLSGAERPVLVIGRGVLNEGQTAAVAQLAERTGIPVAVLQYSPDAFPTDHALALGPLGRNGYGSANRVVPKADLIVAIGAKLARPDRPVLCACGDMGAMCNIGELETAVREKIPVVQVIFNDQGLGNERAFQQEHYGGRYYAVDYSNPDFGAIARVFGAHGEQVRKPGELEGALERAFASGKPAVIDVLIDKKTLAPVVYRPQ